VCVRVCVWREAARVLTRDRRSRARRASRPHDVLPHPRQGAISRGGRRGGRELANRGAVVNAVASRRFCSMSSRALASERKREREEGGSEIGRVESRTDDVNLARCPRATKSQCCSFRFQIPRALQGARGRSLRGLSASSRTSERRENCRVWQIVLCAQVAHAIAVIGVLLSRAEIEQPL
jgi:hypothetical protein